MTAALCGHTLGVQITDPQGLTDDGSLFGIQPRGTRAEYFGDNRAMLGHFFVATRRILDEPGTADDGCQVWIHDPYCSYSTSTPPSSSPIKSPLKSRNVTHVASPPSVSTPLPAKSGGWSMAAIIATVVILALLATLITVHLCLPIG